MGRVCTYCNSPDHTAFYCRVPRKIEYKHKDISCDICQSKWHYTSLCPYRTKKMIQPGKVWHRWTECKREWFKLYGKHHLCHYCGIGLEPKTITLDHKISRSRAPELRYDFNNLVPCCWECNGLKGSLNHDEYVHTCHL